MSAAKLDDLFDHAEANLDDLFSAAEQQDTRPDFMRSSPEQIGQALDMARQGKGPAPEMPQLGKGERAQPVYSPDSSGQVESYVPVRQSNPGPAIGGAIGGTLGFLAGGPVGAAVGAASGSGLTTRLTGAAIPSEKTRGVNEQGQMKSFGEALSDEETGLARVPREKLKQILSEQWSQATDEEKPYWARVLHTLGAEAAGAGYGVASAIEDPAILFTGGAGKISSTAQRFAPEIKEAGRAIATAPNRAGGRLAEEMSGVSEEALRMGGTKEGRAALQAASGKQKEIGDELIARIEAASDVLPEQAKVDEALKGMGDISVQSAIDAMQAAKRKAVEGSELFPNEIAANEKIDKYINALRGGPEPTNFPAATGRARRNLTEAQGEAANLTDLSKLAGEDVSAATAAKASAQSDLGRAGQRIGTMKKHETDFGWWYDEAKTEAKKAADAARKAADELEVSGTISGIRGKDLDAARKTADAADLNYASARAAEQLYAGKSLNEVGKDLIKTHKLRGEKLREALDKAKAKVESQPEPPNLMRSAPGYRELRKRTDYNINFQDEGADIVNEALKAGRGEMKNTLIQTARDSGIPGYEDWMKSWSNKIDKLDELKKIIGSNTKNRAQRVESFVGNLFGKNKEYKRQLIRDLDEVIGGDILGQVKTASLAAELGPKGKAGLVPRQFTGRSSLGLLGAIAGGTLTGNPVVALAPALFSSPLIASRFTLPVLKGLENVMLKSGGYLSARSKNALAAMLKTRDAAIQGRLLQTIQQDTEAVAPMRNVAQSDQTQTQDRRFAGR